MSFWTRLIARWRIYRNLCPNCNSDAPEIDTCWCCHGNREYPLSIETRLVYKRQFGLDK